MRVVASTTKTSLRAGVPTLDALPTRPRRVLPRLLTSRALLLAQSLHCLSKRDLMDLGEVAPLVGAVAGVCVLHCSQRNLGVVFVPTRCFLQEQLLCGHGSMIDRGANQAGTGALCRLEKEFEQPLQTQQKRRGRCVGSGHMSQVMGLW